MTKKVLVIDDDPEVRAILRMTLEGAGYDVVTVGSGMEGLASVRHNGPDAVLLDVTMPIMDGWMVCRRLREITDVPIIMLTVRGQERDVARGLNLGADDYVIKPWSNRELVARIRAAMRRANALATAYRQDSYSCGDLTIDLAHREVIRGDKTIEVTPIEFHLLACLASRPGQVVPYADLIAKLWGTECAHHMASLRVHVHNLRQKIEKSPRHPHCLLGKRSIGYYLAQGETG
jgi:DNA-binding response OmpR family regulator